MKKYFGALVIIGALAFLPSHFVKADDASSTPANVYFFGDGKGYNVDGTQEYFCFGTTGQQSCYDLEGTFAFVRQLQDTVANLQNSITDLQNQVNNLASSTPTVNPVTPPSQPVGNPAPVDTTPLIFLNYYVCSNIGVGCPNYDLLQPIIKANNYELQQDNFDSVHSYISTFSKPVTIQYIFTPSVFYGSTLLPNGGQTGGGWSASGTPIIYSDNNFDNVHDVVYKGLLDPNITYVLNFTATDESGNTVTVTGSGPGEVNAITVVNLTTNQ